MSSIFSSINAVVYLFWPDKAFIVNLLEITYVSLSYSHVFIILKLHNPELIRNEARKSEGKKKLRKLWWFKNSFLEPSWQKYLLKYVVKWIKEILLNFQKNYWIKHWNRTKIQYISIKFNRVIYRNKMDFVYWLLILMKTSL